MINLANGAKSEQTKKNRTGERPVFLRKNRPGGAVAPQTSTSGASGAAVEKRKVRFWLFLVTVTV